MWEMVAGSAVAYGVPMVLLLGLFAKAWRLPK